MLYWRIYDILSSWKMGNFDSVSRSTNKTWLRMPNIKREKTASKISISSIAIWLHYFKKEHTNTNAFYVEDVNGQMPNPITNDNKMNTYYFSNSLLIKGQSLKFRYFLKRIFIPQYIPNYAVGIKYIVFVTWYEKHYGYTTRQRRFLQKFKTFLLSKTHLVAAKKNFSHRNIWKLFETHIFIQTNIKRILILNKHRNRHQADRKAICAPSSLIQWISLK